jgi:hypothetical protein
MLGVHVNAVPPQARGDVLAADQLPRALDQENQQFHRNALEFNRVRPSPELKAGDVELKLFEGPFCAGQNPSAVIFTQVGVGSQTPVAVGHLRSEQVQDIFTTSLFATCLIARMMDVRVFDSLLKRRK